MNIPKRSGKRPKASLRQANVALILNSSNDFIKIDTVVKALSLPRDKAARLLVQEAQKGHIKRIQRGIYAPVDPALFDSEQILDDPWIIVPQLFSPGYVGGANALSYWGLTDQIFLTLCVFTTKKFRKKNLQIQGVPFTLNGISNTKLFGLKSIWRAHTQLSISNSSRTMIDVLNNPAIGGGIQHVASCLNEYLLHYEKDIPTLMEYAKKFNNGAIYKRLGFLLSLVPGFDDLKKECLSEITTGNSKLDPLIPCVHLIKKWNLWVPTYWKTRVQNDTQK